MTSLSDEIKAYGNFLTNLLNCKLNPNDISASANECLNIMKRYLGYNNPKWNKVQIIGTHTFDELVSKTEHGFFKALIAPCIRAYSLGGFHPRKDSIFNERRKKLIDEAFRKHSDSASYSWGKKNESTQQDFVFYIEFALLRKNLRKVVTRIINGDTLERIQSDDFLGNFLLRLKSEYLDLNQQIVIRDNQVKIVPLMTDVPNKSYSATSFLNGYLIPCLSYCLMFCPKNENTLQRIKKCHRCDRFFVANRIDYRIKHCSGCSRKSSLTGEARNVYQRKYYRKKKLEKRAKEREDKIANYIDKLGCTRKQAEELIKADSKF